MINTRQFLRVAVIGFSLVSAGITGNGPARGQSYPGDPVEELSKALKMRVGDPMKNPEELTYRQTNVTKKVEALRTISAIHRGLALDGWLDKELIGEDDPLRPEATIDRAIRVKLMERYLAILRGALESGAPTTQLAAANLIADLGTSIRAIGGNKMGLNRILAPDLIKLIKTGAPAVRDSAIRALANINPDPNLAVPALGELLRSTDVSIRRSAATGLNELMKKISQIVAGKSRNVGGGVEASPNDVFNMARLLIPRVAVGFADTDSVVRLQSTEALYHGAVALGELVPEPQKMT
ncbi:MAG TPA: HEAT repeat domain-containing protein, partial [Gemmataceae bacterium]|nr:HEAT repeat domain-containing protein [Gemmataceae bacterium]